MQGSGNQRGMKVTAAGAGVGMVLQSQPLKVIKTLGVIAGQICLARRHCPVKLHINPPTLVWNSTQRLHTLDPVKQSDHTLSAPPHPFPSAHNFSLYFGSPLRETNGSCRMLHFRKNKEGGKQRQRNQSFEESLCLSFKDIFLLAAETILNLVLGEGGRRDGLFTFVTSFKSHLRDPVVAMMYELQLIIQLNLCRLSSTKL